MESLDKVWCLAGRNRLLLDVFRLKKLMTFIIPEFWLYPRDTALPMCVIDRNWVGIKNNRLVSSLPIFCDKKTISENMFNLVFCDAKTAHTAIELALRIITETHSIFRYFPVFYYLPEFWPLWLPLTGLYTTLRETVSTIHSSILILPCVLMSPSAKKGKTPRGRMASKSLGECSRSYVWVTLLTPCGRFRSTFARQRFMERHCG